MVCPIRVCRYTALELDECTNDLDINLTHLTPPFLRSLPPTPCPQCQVAWAISRCLILRADRRTFGVVVSKSLAPTHATRSFNDPASCLIDTPSPPTAHPLPSLTHPPTNTSTLAHPPTHPPTHPPSLAYSPARSPTRFSASGTLSGGDMVHVAEEGMDGWYVGKNLTTNQLGTFPGNFVVTTEAAQKGGLLGPAATDAGAGAAVATGSHGNAAVAASVELGSAAAVGMTPSVGMGTGDSGTNEAVALVDQLTSDEDFARRLQLEEDEALAVSTDPALSLSLCVCPPCPLLPLGPLMPAAPRSPFSRPRRGCTCVGCGYAVAVECVQHRPCSFLYFFIFQRV